MITFSAHVLAACAKVSRAGMTICLLYGSIGRGKLIKTDCPSAIEWLRTAAAQNDRHAQFHLAQCYEKGRGVSRNGSLEHYRSAAERKGRKAQSGGG
jgi:TPR repeat protein